MQKTFKMQSNISKVYKITKALNNKKFKANEKTRILKQYEQECITTNKNMSVIFLLILVIQSWYEYFATKYSIKIIYQIFNENYL